MTRTETPQMNLDASALRDALDLIKRISDDFELYANSKAGALDKIYDIAIAALSALPRNCDVGTAEEQTTRHDKPTSTNIKPAASK